MKHSTYPASDRELIWIKRIKRYILRNINEDQSLETIADKCLVTQYFITNRFPLISGLTVIEYRRKFRLIKAAKRIAKGRPVKQVVRDAHYNSTGDFNRAFKRMFSLTPLQYINVYMRKN